MQLMKLVLVVEDDNEAIANHTATMECKAALGKAQVQPRQMQSGDAAQPSVETKSPAVSHRPAKCSKLSAANFSTGCINNHQAKQLTPAVPMRPKASCQSCSAMKQ